MKAKLKVEVGFNPERSNRFTFQKKGPCRRQKREIVRIHSGNIDNEMVTEVCCRKSVGFLKINKIIVSPRGVMRIITVFMCSRQV